MASLTRWTWVSVNSRSWWWTGRPGMLRFMGSQRVGHDWATELYWTMKNQRNYRINPIYHCKYIYIYLEINLPKETKELYTENYKTLMKEIKDDVNRWRDIPCSWVGRSILWKWLYYQMQSTESMWSLSNYHWHFHRTRTKNFTIHMETRKTPNSQNSLKKEEWSWRNQPSWLQIIPDNTVTYLQSSSQYGTGTKTEI